MNRSIFKAYDVRGVYPTDLNKEDAYRIGFATAKFLQVKSASRRTGKKISVVVGEDARASSPDLRGAVIDSMTKAGADVQYINFATTPLFYYSVIKLKADGGIMATASHNPPEYGGLKIVSAGAGPIGRDSGLLEIEELAQGSFEPAEEPGKIEEVNLTNEYVDFVIKSSRIDPSNLKNLKLVVDAGNGMTSLVLKPLFEKLGIEYTPLFFDIDCSFPNHSSDISKPEALIALRDKVLETKADLGVAFDGDGDRAFFIDENGITVKSEFILALLCANAGSFFRKPKAIYDLRVSKSIKELLGSRGTRSRAGHSFIKLLMRSQDADMGAELSGHYFFRETGYAESSLLAMLKLLAVKGVKQKPISELVKPYNKYFHSGEINMTVADREEVINLIRNKYKGGKIDELDGISIDMWDSEGWWFNLRPSNTEPILRLVVEGKTKDLLDSKVLELKQVIS